MPLELRVDRRHASLVRCTIVPRYSLSGGRYKWLQRYLARVQHDDVRNLPPSDIDLFSNYLYPALCDQTDSARVEAALASHGATPQTRLLVVLGGPYGGMCH